MAYLALVTATVIWGATFPAIKIALGQVPPFSFLFFRYLLGTIVVLGIVFVMRGRLPMNRKVLGMSAVATMFLFLGNAAQTVGLQYTTASNSAFITALYVVLVPLFLRQFDGRTWGAAGLALGGLWALVDPSVAMNQGDLWSMLCAVGFAGHIVCLESFTQRGVSPSLFAWQMVLMTVVLGPAMVLEGPDPVLLTPTIALITALIICGVLATGALAIQVWAQKFIPANRVALIFILEPVFAAWLAWMILDEQLGSQGMLGSGLIVAAVVLGTYRRTESRLSQPLHRFRSR